jgi:hypothetical protein
MVDETTVEWLTEPGDHNDVPLGGDGAQVLRVEDVYEKTGECEHGSEPIGVVGIVETTTGQGNRVLVTATFDFDDGDSLVVQGAAERIEHKGRPSFRGRLGIGGGTGKFKGRRGQVDVDVCNPKHWIVGLGP